MEYVLQKMPELSEKLRKASDDAVQSLFLIKQNNNKMKDLFDADSGEVPSQFSKIETRLKLDKKEFTEFQ